MRKIYKIVNVALIFMIIGVFLYPNPTYSSDFFCLRSPLSDNSLKRISYIYKNGEESFKKGNPENLSADWMTAVRLLRNTGKFAEDNSLIMTKLVEILAKFKEEQDEFFAVIHPLSDDLFKNNLFKKTYIKLEKIRPTLDKKNRIALDEQMLLLARIELDLYMAKVYTEFEAKGTKEESVPLMMRRFLRPYASIIDYLKCSENLKEYLTYKPGKLNDSIVFLDEKTLRKTLDSCFEFCLKIGPLTKDKAEIQIEGLSEDSTVIRLIFNYEESQLPIINNFKETLGKLLESESSHLKFKKLKYSQDKRVFEIILRNSPIAMKKFITTIIKPKTTEL